MQLNHIKLHRLLYACVLVSTLLFTAGCDKDEDNEPDNEQELITTVTLTFTPATGSAIIATAKDLDGTGGTAPTIQPVALKANTDYTLTIRLLDETKTPTDVISDEVAKEKEAHQFCFVATGAAPTPAIQDKDANSKPVGLTSTLKTGAAGSGTLKVTLKHELNKSAADPCSTGETDVEQTYPVTIAN